MKKKTISIILLIISLILIIIAVFISINNKNKESQKTKYCINSKDEAFDKIQDVFMTDLTTFRYELEEETKDTYMVRLYRNSEKTDSLFYVNKKDCNVSMNYSFEVKYIPKES